MIFFCLGAEVHHISFLFYHPIEIDRKTLFGLFFSTSAFKMYEFQWYAGWGILVVGVHTS